MKLNILTYSLIILVYVFAGSSCKKYLDAKPDKSLVTPSSLEDLQLLLDNYSIINMNYPYTLEILSDNYYIPVSTYDLVTELDRNLYLWKKNATIVQDWNFPYSTILTLNTALDELNRIGNPAIEPEKYNNVKGSVLFLRSYYYYALAQLFIKPYNKTTAVTDLGLPLRLSSDINIPSVRSTVQNTYDEILKGFKESLQLLPETPMIKTRPSVPAAYGGSAKTYLAMCKYDSAFKYADLSITSYGADNLIDYNTLLPSSLAPISRFNKEVVFQIRSVGPLILANSFANLDTNLLLSYPINDLRKDIYYHRNPNGSFYFKGDYDGRGSQGYVFGGIVLDEMFLIRAEGYARQNNIPMAMQDLNKLLVNRYESSSFSPLTASSREEAIDLILLERRKELVFRGTRWTDLRRLQNEPGFSVTPKRFINGELYELPPGSNGYTLQIPQTVINLTGIPQND